MYFDTFAISGSDEIKLTNFDMDDTPSNMPSSMLISKTWAPFSTCSLATASASCVLQRNKGLKNKYTRVANFSVLKETKKLVLITLSG